MSLEEQSVWEEEVHELGVAERALGGRGGVSNRQAQQLANRTKYLRDAIAQLQDQQIASLDINEVGHLIVTLGDASQVDLGVVVGPQGVGMPLGGLVGQMPVKQSLADFDFMWVDQPEDGVSITGASISGAGHLILSLSNGSQIDAGTVFKSVLEFADVAGFPAIGESGVIYISADPSESPLHRWDGVAYKAIGGLASIAGLTLLANLTGVSAIPIATSLSDVRDALAALVSAWTFAAAVTAPSLQANTYGLSYFGTLKATLLGGDLSSNDGALLQGTGTGYISFGAASAVSKITLQTSASGASLDSNGTLRGGVGGISLLADNSYVGGLYLASTGDITPMSSSVKLGATGSRFYGSHFYDCVSYEFREDYYVQETPATGATIDAYAGHIRVNPATDIDALTINLRGNLTPKDGNTNVLMFTKGVRGITWSAVGGATIVGAPASVGPGDSLVFYWMSSYSSWHCVQVNRGNGAASSVVDASGGGTITPSAHVRALKLTGAAPAALTIDCTNLPDGEPLTIYSVNGVTALTLSGGTNLGALTTLAAAGIGKIVRCASELIVQ